jgi:hypothetical protein
MGNCCCSSNKVLDATIDHDYKKALESAKVADVILESQGESSKIIVENLKEESEKVKKLDNLFKDDPSEKTNRKELFTSTFKLDEKQLLSKIQVMDNRASQIATLTSRDMGLPFRGSSDDALVRSAAAKFGKLPKNKLLAGSAIRDCKTCSEVSTVLYIDHNFARFESLEFSKELKLDDKIAITRDGLEVAVVSNWLDNKLYCSQFLVNLNKDEPSILESMYERMFTTFKSARNQQNIADYAQVLFANSAHSSELTRVVAEVLLLNETNICFIKDILPRLTLSRQSSANISYELDFCVTKEVHLENLKKRIHPVLSREGIIWLPWDEIKYIASYSWGGNIDTYALWNNAEKPVNISIGKNTYEMARRALQYVDHLWVDCITNCASKECQDIIISVMGELYARQDIIVITDSNIGLNTDSALRGWVYQERLFSVKPLTNISSLWSLDRTFVDAVSEWMVETEWLECTNNSSISLILKKVWGFVDKIQKINVNCIGDLVVLTSYNLQLTVSDVFYHKLLTIFGRRNFDPIDRLRRGLSSEAVWDLNKSYSLLKTLIEDHYKSNNNGGSITNEHDSYLDPGGVKLDVCMSSILISNMYAIFIQSDGWKYAYDSNVLSADEVSRISLGLYEDLKTMEKRTYKNNTTNTSTLCTDGKNESVDLVELHNWSEKIEIANIKYNEFLFDSAFLCLKCWIKRNYLQRTKVNKNKSYIKECWVKLSDVASVSSTTIESVVTKINSLGNERVQLIKKLCAIVRMMQVFGLRNVVRLQASMLVEQYQNCVISKEHDRSIATLGAVAKKLGLTCDDLASATSVFACVISKDVCGMYMIYDRSLMKGSCNISGLIKDNAIHFDLGTLEQIGNRVLISLDDDIDFVFETSSTTIPVGETTLFDEPVSVKILESDINIACGFKRHGVLLTIKRSHYTKILMRLNLREMDHG